MLEGWQWLVVWFLKVVEVWIGDVFNTYKCLDCLAFSADFIICLFDFGLLRFGHMFCQ